MQFLSDSRGTGAIPTETYTSPWCELRSHKLRDDHMSIDAAIEKATKLGAQVALPKIPVPGVGAVAAIVDPQGNICGLWEQAR